MELILCGNLFLTSNGGKAISFIAESPKFCQKTLVSHLLSKSPLQPKNRAPYLSSYCCIYFSKEATSGKPYSDRITKCKEAKNNFLDLLEKLFSMQKVFCCIFSSLKLFVKPKSLETIFTLSAYMKCQLWNTKKVRKLCSSTINTNHYWNCRLSNLHFAQIHTLHFYKYQYRYITILTYRKLHIQTYFLPSCICRQEKRWWEYIRTCNIKQYTSVL